MMLITTCICFSLFWPSSSFIRKYVGSAL